MGLNFKLIQRTTKTTTKDVVHSSGYASAQSGAFLGAAGGDTFAERQRVNHNRKLVQGYRNARIAHGVNGMPRPKTYDEEKRLAKLRAKIGHEKNEQVGLTGARTTVRRSNTNIAPQTAPPKWRSW